MNNGILPNTVRLIEQIESEFEMISDKRRNVLSKLADYISNKIESEEEVNLIFICTHNSRRSLMAQIWSQTAAAYNHILNVRSFSGGTEATEFDYRAVNAMRYLGFEIEVHDREDNPVYNVKYSTSEPELECFSKRYFDRYNPQTKFAAVMTCSDADEACPVVLGAERRFSIPYDDPKAFDGSEQEKEKYIERALQIGREMLYLFSLVRNQISR